MSKATSHWPLNVIWNNFHWTDWIRLLLLTACIRIELDAHTERTNTINKVPIIQIFLYLVRFQAIKINYRNNILYGFISVYCIYEKKIIWTCSHLTIKPNTRAYMATHSPTDASGAWLWRSHPSHHAVVPLQETVGQSWVCRSTHNLL